MKRIFFSLAAILAISAGIFPAATGKPFMTVYAAKEIGGHFQNWSIIQDARGVMYVGNGFGVMEFDGSSWRLIMNSNRSFARSFASDKDGRIYVGGGAELGYLEPDSLGNMQHVSLLDWIKEKDRNFTAVNSIRATPDGIYFQSTERLFRFQRQESRTTKPRQQEAWTVKTWQAPGGFSYLLWNGQGLYIMQMGTGLMKLENDSLVMVPGSERFANQRISFILPFPGRPGVHLLATRTSGLYLWQNNVFTPLATEVDGVLHNAGIGCGLVLPDGRLALGTLGDGCFVIDAGGAVKLHLTTSSGLTSNTVAAVYLDRQKNLWLTGDGGTAILEYDSPLSQVVIPSGTTPTSFRNYKDVFYIACNNGIYFLDRDSQLQPVTGAFETPQCFQLQQIENELFLAKGAGLLLVAGNKARKVRLPEDISLRISSLYPCRGDKREIIAGMSDGACILRYDSSLPNRLTFTQRIAGLHEYVISIVEPDPGVFWLSTYDEGVIRLTKRGSGFSDATVERFGPEQSLPKGTVIVYQAAHHLCFTTAQGVYRFDELRRRFEPDPLFNGIRLGSNPAEGVIAEDTNGNIWANMGRETVLLKKERDGSYQLQKQLLARFGDESVNAIFPDSDGAVWFGVVNFAYRYLPQAEPSVPRPGATLIRRVAVTNRAPLFSGMDSGQPQAAPELPYHSNELHFEFAMPSYINPKANEFQNKLEGFDKSWSEWSRENKRYYTNLPSGHYRFMVRARNIQGQESTPTAYAFTILAPWYKTWPAYLGFLLAALATILSFVRLRTRSLQEKSKALEKVVRERTVEIQASNDDLRATQAKLVTQSKLAALGALTAGIAHEIKNPLNFINNFAELTAELVVELRQEMEKNTAKLAPEDRKVIEEILATVQDNAGKIKEHGKRADSIVKSMLQHSRGKAGEKQSTDINAMLAEDVNLAYHGLRAQDNSFNVTIETEFDPAVGKIEVVPQDISRVFLNIISNACYEANRRKTTAGPGFSPTLTVRSRKLKDSVEVRVRDNGNGIPLAVRDKLFTPFFTTKPTGQGTGLGLSISHDIIVHGHNGELSFESEEGRFTEFIIMLPC